MKLKALVGAVLLSTVVAVSAQAAPLYLTCKDSVKSLNRGVGQSFSVVCPNNCMTGSLWGTDSYTADSAVCVAAVHAGVITANGGWVKVKVVKGLPAYAGSTRNNVTSSNWGAYDFGYTVSK